jgi:serine/threonine protein kinase/tetratricopeptide (TPR) repeat protein
VADLRERLQLGLADRYQLKRELGRGGMATVFLAHDLRHDRPVALKVLHAELAATLGPERFLREIKLAARLQHPHILTVHDSGETDGQLWFTMPFVEGESLRDRLRRDKQLPIEVALRIATDAARALDYAHQHGVVHRDIKPENLLLTTDGSSLVADFGIARALSGGDEHLTQTGMSVGTPAYMSPEQTAGERNLDARTDIYSLACVLYEMLAGEPPFTGQNAQAVLAKRLSGEVPRVRQIRPSVPEEMENAVTRALAPVAADRFASAAEFARALLPTVARTTPMPTVPLAPAAGPGSSSWTTARRSSRRRIPVVATALVLGFLIGLGVLFAWRRSHPGGDDERGGVKRVAVLPFENLGDSSDAYFADGVSDEIRGKMSQIAGLAVIARASSNEYRHTTKTPQEIARELGAEYLLTATVRWEKRPDGTSRVRVSPELVRVQPGAVPTTKWQQGFDAALTDVFQVQAEIAGQVASALDVALTDSTRRELAVRPTQNLDAYDAYLRGKEIRTGDIAPGVLHAAEAEFQRAIALDSTFAAAWAELAATHILLFRLGGTQARDAEAAGREVERAAALGPELPDVHAAKGLYQEIVRGDAASALREYEAGLRVAPNRGDLLGLVSGAEANLGQSAAALSHLERAARLDPRSPGVAVGLFSRYFELRRYAEARAALDRARALRPSSLSLIYSQALLHAGEGDLAGARQALQLAHGVTDSTTVVAYVALREDLLWLLDDAQQRLLLTLTPAALDGGRADWALALAETYWRRGDRRKARAYADTAGLAYSPLIQNMSNEADRAQLAGLQALALAYLGKAQEAVEKGDEALSAAKLAAAPTWQRSYIQFLLARIHLLAEQPEKALDLLEPLLKTSGSRISPGLLKIDPTFDPLRGNPRFQRLVNGS